MSERPPQGAPGDGPPAYARNYSLRLYIAGTTPASMRALANVRRICRRHLPGRHRLEVVDVFEHPTSALDADLLCAPTLVKDDPPPVRRLVGDLSDESKVLVGLDLAPRR